MKVIVERPEIITLLYKQERSDADYGSCLWARFYLDTKNYTMSIESDCGNYSYGWVPTPEHESFLELLCRMNGDYLLGKLAERTIVNSEETWKAVQELLELEDVVLEEQVLQDIKETCHQLSADVVINDVMSILNHTEACGKFDEYDISQCVEMDYRAGAKKIVEVFLTAIVPMLRDLDEKEGQGK